jgi:hypothetical protein
MTYLLSGSAAGPLHTGTYVPDAGDVVDVASVRTAFSNILDNTLYNYSLLTPTVTRSVSISAMMDTTGTAWNYGNVPFGLPVWYQNTLSNSYGIVAELDTNEITSQYIDSVSVWINGSASDTDLPEHLPSFEIYQCNNSGGFALLCALVVDTTATLSAYKAGHEVKYTFPAGTSSSLTSRTIVVVYGEYGTNSNANMHVNNIFFTTRKTA